MRIPLSDDNVRSKYRHEDERGRYGDYDLTGPKTSDGKSGQPWRGWNPTDIGRCWSVPRTGDYAAWIDTNLIPGYLAEGSILARLDMLHQAELIIFTRNGTPRLKRYLHASPGQVPPDVWTDIPPVNSQAKERTGYPTQKPTPLLERIVKASSKPGDMILDPFCGCATALVAADRLGRKWAGIDLSPLAIKLVNDRIAEDRYDKKGGEIIGGGLFRAIALTDPPKRTDLGDLPNYRTHRHRLYGEQEGVCNGCETHFPFRVMDVDHIMPRSKGAPITRIIFNCFAPATTEPRAGVLWPNGGPQMTAKKQAQSTRKRGRPETRVIKLDATPQQAASAIFSAVKRPDPELRAAQSKRRLVSKG